MRRCGFIARSILINLWYVIIILSCGDWQFSRRPACDGPGLQRPSMARRRQSRVKWLHDLHLTHPLRERPVRGHPGKEYISQDFVLGYVVGLIGGRVEHSARTLQRENTYHLHDSTYIYILFYVLCIIIIIKKCHLSNCRIL